jgi:hypothetical protein
MLTKTTIALTLAAALGAASAAFANEPTDADGGGYRVQNWQAIQGHRAYNAYGAYNADGFRRNTSVVLPHRRAKAVASAGRTIKREMRKFVSRSERPRVRKEPITPPLAGLSLLATTGAKPATGSDASTSKQDEFKASTNHHDMLIAARRHRPVVAGKRLADEVGTAHRF